jgi:formate-dependent nitrite reductase membrane component NrfD
VDCLMTTNLEYRRTWENRRKRARSAGDEAKDSYYGLPVIKKAHWQWEIVLYFFIGGISGASYAIATVARWFGGERGEDIARAGHYLSFIGVIPSTAFLIMDLKRPERFHHMLRVLKLRSPMSIGSWVLMVFGGLSTLVASIQAARDGEFGRSSAISRLLLALPSRAIEAAGLLPALAFAGYTGVLLAATAVPLWTKRHLLMGPLFVASAFSNATAAIALWLALRERPDKTALERLEKLESLALIAELALLVSIKRQVGPVTARPLEHGRTGLLHSYGVLVGGIGVPLLLQAKTVVLGKPPARTMVLVASALVLVGGLVFRYVMVIGGHESAEDPAATFEMTRGQRRP